MQVCAWERLLPFQPISHDPPKPNPPNPSIELFFEFYAERSKARVDRDVALGDLQVYRDVLDGMASDMVCLYYFCFTCL